MSVCNAMRRDRFLQICRFIHCADNTQIDAKDKAWKIRPLMNMIKNKCLENFVPQKHLAYDKSMVKYFGKHGCKQFIRGKPIRFGYKMWCINTNDGYLINFELYQGKDPRENEKYNSIFGKAVSPLIVMLEDLPNSKKNLPYSLYMDNLFTGINVFNYLKYLGYSAIGTIRQNRIPKNCPLTDKNKFSKKERGSFETAIEKKGILLVRWMDNAVVTMASTDVGTEKVSSVKRYSQKHKKHINVSRPKLIAQYNQYMGGTDQMDQNIATYRIGVRGKKWWWPIFTWLLEIPMNNSWTLYKKANSKQITQLEFRRELVQKYLQRYGVARIGAGRPSRSLSSSDSRVSDDIRYDRMDHLVTYTQEKKRKRCAKDGCKSVGRTMCVKLDGWTAVQKIINIKKQHPTWLCPVCSEDSSTKSICLKQEIGNINFECIKKESETFSKKMNDQLSDMNLPDDLVVKYELINKKLIADVKFMVPKNFHCILNMPKDALKELADIANIDLDKLKLEIQNFSKVYPKISKSVEKRTKLIYSISETEEENDMEIELKNKEVDGIYDNMFPCNAVYRNHDQTNCLHCVYSLIYNLNLHVSAYTTLCEANEFFLTLSVTEVNCERTFSKLKLIKTRLRSNLNQENLESLLLMSVEKELLDEIDVSEVVYYLKESSTIMYQMLNL
ncbi:hypothetical protein QTP88_009361 [Uroleucon formosanum]